MSTPSHPYDIRREAFSKASEFEVKGIKKLEAMRHAIHGTEYVTCKRCGGSGTMNTRVVYCGLPGTCYRCDGYGTVAVRNGYDHAQIQSVQLEALRIAYRGVIEAEKALVQWSKTARPFEIHGIGASLDRSKKVLEKAAQEVKTSSSLVSLPL